MRLALLLPPLLALLLALSRVAPTGWPVSRAEILPARLGGEPAAPAGSALSPEAEPAPQPDRAAAAQPDPAAAARPDPAAAVQPDPAAAARPDPAAAAQPDPAAAAQPDPVAAQPDPRLAPDPGAESAPSAEERLRRARELEALGQSDPARELLVGLETEEALFLLGRLERELDPASAARTLDRFLERFPRSSLQEPARVLRAQASIALRDWSRAAQLLAGVEGPLAPLARLLQVGAQARLGHPDQARAFYQALLLDPASQPGWPNRALVALAQAAADRGDHQAALAAYQEATAERAVPDDPALALAMARLLTELGRTEEAVQALGRVLDHPAAPQASEALALLETLGRPADSLTRARVALARGEAAAAVSLLEAYLGQPQPQVARARLLLGTARQQLGDFDGAAAAFELLLQEGQAPRQEQEQALLRWAWMLVRSGQPGRAAELYQDFVRRFPTSADAPRALWRAAILFQELGRGEAAAAVEERLARSHPRSAYVEDLDFRQGLLAFRQGDLDHAREHWQRLAERARSSQERLRARFWLGRAALAQDRPEEARAHLERVLAADPEGYYGLRARDLLGQDAPPRAAPEPAAWLRDGGASVETGDLSGDARLADQASYQRGLAYLALGRTEEAAYELGRLAQTGDPLALFQLARVLSREGLHRQALGAAAQLRRQLGGGPAELPEAVARWLYPAPYEERVREEAGRNGLDALWYLALIRQESLFDPGAVSSAGARGLTQVIPATGAAVARELDRPDYAPGDLTRPHVSLAFGAHYLGQQLERFDFLPAALAAYNAGPGNAIRWMEAMGPRPDADLYLELIDIAETRAYLQRITEHHRQYLRLYGE